jgi:hypothetical protein
LRPPGPAGQVAPGTDVAGLVGALAEVQQQGRRERAEDGDREPKQITEVYRETYTTLVQTLQSQTHPKMSHPCGNASRNSAKGEQHTVIANEFNRVCRAKGLAPELYCPIVTTTVKQMIT